MNSKRIGWLTIGIFFIAVKFARAEMIRTAVPRASLNYLSIYVAEAKGLFKDEGLENQTIVIGGPAAIAAAVSENVGRTVEGDHVPDGQSHLVFCRASEHQTGRRSQG